MFTLIYIYPCVDFKKWCPESLVVLPSRGGGTVPSSWIWVNFSDPVETILHNFEAMSERPHGFCRLFLGHSFSGRSQLPCKKPNDPETLTLEKEHAGVPVGNWRWAPTQLTDNINHQPRKPRRTSAQPSKAMSLSSLVMLHKIWEKARRSQPSHLGHT